MSRTHQTLVFYHKPPDPFGRAIASVEARRLLPLKTLAYRVPPHTFIDFFQMSKEMVMTGGNLDKLEEEAGTIRYTISGEEFRKMFILLDGIYPE
ncbi:hypothetical protein IV203_003670 [Nitzschia inconspicua]|uniref:Uncharacterized protein n=1 Tax=Nitzschia inconspicua TaxID=303405 RepID=A0A9K3PR67_9STRA|nr:hypothetical protein IV203_003670 [Nitzschia inconspicua]